MHLRKVHSLSQLMFKLHDQEGYGPQSFHTHCIKATFSDTMHFVAKICEKKIKIDSTAGQLTNP